MRGWIRWNWSGPTLRDKAQVIGAKSNYDQLVTSIEFQKSTLESDVAAQQAELNLAQAKLDELLNGSRQQDIQQSVAAVTDATAQLEFARLDWERSQTLFKNDDISKQQYDQARTKFESAQAMLRQTQEKESLMKEGPRKEDIAAARADVAHAQAALKTAEANRLEVKRKEEELMQRQSEIERTQAQAGISQKQLSDTEVYTPIDGVVLVKSAEPGEVLAAGTTVVTIGDLEHPWLRAYINETDLGRVKLGQKVKLSHGFFSGQDLLGHGFLYCVRSRVHSQADSDQGRARETGLPHQDRSGQQRARAQEQHAGGRRNPAMSIIRATNLTRRFGSPDRPSLRWIT